MYTLRPDKDVCQSKVQIHSLSVTEKEGECEQLTSPQDACHYPLPLPDEAR